MNLSRPARRMAGRTLLAVPAIIYGGLTALSVVTAGAHAPVACRWGRVHPAPDDALPRATADLIARLR